MDLQEFLKQRWVIYGVLGVARMMPRRTGYALMAYAARRISKSKPKVYRKLRENIRHIPGTNNPPVKLDQLTSQAFHNAGRFYFDFYHLIQGPLEGIDQMVDIPEEVYDKIQAVQSSGRGVLLAGMHMGNIDLGMVGLSQNRLEILALSTANPNEAYKIQNKLRSGSGLKITPITPASLKSAIKRLKKGGIVATGVDWPHPEEQNLTNVFGKPAYVPLGTARLALLSGAVTLVLGFYAKPDGVTSVYISDPIEVIRTGNKEEEINLNTSTYIQYFEEFVSRHPDQWMMYHQFWA